MVFRCIRQKHQYNCKSFSAPEKVTRPICEETISRKTAIASCNFFSTDRLSENAQSFSQYLDLKNVIQFRLFQM